MNKKLRYVIASVHPVKCGNEFKLILLTFKVLNDQAPSYLTDLIVPYYPNRALHCKTALSGLLVVHCALSKVGGRAFSYPLLWSQVLVLMHGSLPHSFND